MTSKQTLIIVFGLAIIGIATVRSLPWGQVDVICRATGERLSEEQYIERAVEVVLEKYPGSIRVPVDEAFLAKKNAIHYSNVDEFIAENPSCCSFSQRGLDGFPMPPRSRSGETLAGFVIIRHDVKYHDPSSELPKKIRRAEAYPSHYLMDACGAVQPVV